MISNATSDLQLYLTDGVNGFMASGLSRAEVAAVLERTTGLNDTVLLAMKRVCSLDNPFDIPKWQAETTAFLARLRLPA